MKKVIRKIVKVICFLCIFSLLFTGAQFVLHYRWSYEEDIYTRNVDYMNQKPNSIDVLYFGTSEIYEGIAPIVTYAEEGITGYNFATTYKSAVTTYYQLLFALKYQTPKIVVCDFESLYDDSLPDEQEPIFRKIYETMPDDKIKNDLLEDILRLDSNQKRLYWKIPFLRYHSMWSDLHKRNFQLDNVYNVDYKEYSKGCWLNASEFNGEKYKITKELWKPKDDGKVLSDISMEYYDKFIDVCKSKGIKVLAINSPKISSAAKMAYRYNEMKNYFDSRNVEFFDYNNYASIKKMGLNFKEHYFDNAHLNDIGAIVFSKQLSHDLKNKYSLDDRRKDKLTSTLWNDDLKVFKSKYEY